MSSFTVYEETQIGGKYVSAVRMYESNVDEIMYGVSIFDLDELEETDFRECRKNELFDKYKTVCKELFEALPY